MDNLPFDSLFKEIWAMVSPYVGNVWAVVQRIFGDIPPTPLLIGVVLGMLFSTVFRGLLVVVGLAVAVFLAVRFGFVAPVGG
jgi:hypothetical protein